MEREISIILKLRGARQAKKAVQDVFNNQTQTLVEKFNKRTKKTGDNMDRVRRNSKRAGKSMNSFTKILGRGMAALYLYNRAWTTFGRNFEQGLELQRASEQFDRHVGNVTQMLPELRAATQGIIADFDLLKTANRAFQQGIQPQQISKAFRFATAAAQKLGLSSTDAINTITSAITKQNEGALNTLGIITNVNQAYQTQAALIAKQGGVMSKAMSIQIRQSLIMKELENRFGGLNAVQEDGLMSLERFRASWKNFRAALGDTIGLALQPLTRALTGVLDVTTALLNKLNDTAGFEKFVQLASTAAIIFGGMKFIGGARALMGVFGFLGGSGGRKSSKGLRKINILMGKLGRTVSGAVPSLGKFGGGITRILGLSASFARLIPGWGTAIAAISLAFEPLVFLLGKAWTAGKVFFQLLSGFDDQTGLSRVLKKDADELGNFYYVMETAARMALELNAVMTGVSRGLADVFAPLSGLMDMLGDGIDYVAQEIFGLAKTGPTATSHIDGITNSVQRMVKWVGLAASAVALFIPGLQGLGLAGASVFGGSLISEGLQGMGMPSMGMAAQDRALVTGQNTMPQPSANQSELAEAGSPRPRAMNIDGREDSAEELRKMRKILEKQTGIMEVDSQKNDIRESQKNAGNNVWMRR